jgi:LysM repeat protein
VLKNRNLIFVGFILLLISLGVKGQESPVIVNRSNTIQIIDGKEYFFHAVLRGQTLFSIARAYGVTVEDILAENPDLNPRELRSDQIIRIPVIKEVDSTRVQSSTVTETDFITHQVRRRETVYGISRQYDITENELLEHNPQIRSGLKTNMILKIPREKPATLHFIEYRVPHRQTIYSITREFNVSLNELEKLNPELREGLKAGQILKIPVDYTPQTRPPFIMEQDKIIYPEEPKLIVSDPWCKDPELKNQYNVALMIPLYLDDINEEGEIDDMLKERAFAYLEYYEGIMIALDSIREMGADIRLTVYDVTDSEVKARNAIWQPEMARMDLIIGPFFDNVFKVVADYAKDKNIPIVAPFQADNPDVLARYPLMFQTTPDIETQMKDMAAYVVENHPEENIIIVHNNQESTRNLIASFSESLNQGINLHRYRRDSTNMARLDGYFLDGVYVGERISNVYVVNDSVRNLNRENGVYPKMDFEKYAHQNRISEIIYPRGGMDTLVARMDTLKTNVVISLMGGEAVISNYTRQLNQLRDTFDIVLYGVPQWSNYSSLDSRYLQNLDTHIFTHHFVDYEKIYNKQFIREYRKLNHVEPQTMGFRAVQTGMYFFGALMQYGAEFYRCMDVINQTRSNSSPFVFEKNYSNGGWENKFVYIYRYHDFNLIDVRDKSNDNLGQRK